MDRFQPTDILRFKGSHPLKVKRGGKLGIGNAEKGTEQGVIYWWVITSPQYGGRTGIRMISMVPETRLTPIDEKKVDVS